MLITTINEAGQTITTEVATLTGDELAEAMKRANEVDQELEFDFPELVKEPVKVKPEPTALELYWAQSITQSIHDSYLRGEEVVVYL